MKDREKKALKISYCKRSYPGSNILWRSFSISVCQKIGTLKIGWLLKICPPYEVSRSIERPLAKKIFSQDHHKILLFHIFLTLQYLTYPFHFFIQYTESFTKKESGNVVVLDLYHYVSISLVFNVNYSKTFFSGYVWPKYPLLNSSD